MRLRLVSLSASLVVSLPLARTEAQVAPAQAIVGRWRGTSICVKAEWNAACNDEVVVYDFVPSAQSTGTISLHAKKMVNGSPQPMYDLDFSYDSAAGEWKADFSNSRVRIRWSYRVDGTTLSGRVVFLPSGRVGREVSATRDTAAASP